MPVPEISVCLRFRGGPNPALAQPILGCAPPEFGLEQPEFTLAQPEFDLESPEFTLTPPEFALEPPEFTLAPPVFGLDPPEPARAQPLLRGGSPRVILLLILESRLSSVSISTEKTATFFLNQQTDLYGAGSAQLTQAALKRKGNATTRRAGPLVAVVHVCAVYPVVIPLSSV